MSMYKKAKIYSIRSYQTDEIYIGSTCDTLNKRLGNHRSKYKLYLNGKYNFVTSFEILQYDDHYIELVESYPCNSKEELRKREGEIIRETANCVNKCIAGRSKSESSKQYIQNNKDKIAEQNKKYYENNKEIILEKSKEKATCDICNCEFRKSDIAKHNKTKKHLNNSNVNIEEEQEDIQ